MIHSLPRPFRLLTLLQADFNNNAIRSIDLMTNTVTTIAGNSYQMQCYSDGVGSAACFNYPVDVAVNAAWTRALVVSTEWSELVP